MKSSRETTSMPAAILYWLVFCCAISCFQASSTAAMGTANKQQIAEESGANSEQSFRFIVLKNFQLMEGQISRSNKGWEIRNGQTTTILGPERVWFGCNQKSEAYWGLISRIKASDVESQIKVLHFCLRYQMFAQAQNQIDILQLLPMKATRLESLHRQLTISVTQAEKRQARIEKEKALAAEQRLASGLNTIRPLPPMPKANQSGLASDAPSLKKTPPTVAQVGFEQVVTDDSQPAMPTQAELDRLTDSVPKPAVAFFKRKIEPIMTRSCFAAGCHTPESATMPVMRLSEMRVMPRRMSQRNMHSALAFADAYSPLESPILKMAATPHGGSEAPPLRPRGPEFDRLARWLIAVSNQPHVLHKMPDWMLTQEEIDGIAAMEKRQAMLESDHQAALLEASRSEEPEPVDVSEFESLPPGLLITDPRDTKEVTKGEDQNTSPTKREKSDLPTGKDPFDPDIFNRQFGKRKQQSSNADDSIGK